MKWAIFIPTFLPEKVGGNIIYVYWFATYLVKRGHEVHIFTSSRDNDLKVYEEKNGFTIHRILVSRGSAGSLRFSTTRKITKKFIEIDDKIKFNILNPHAAFQLKYSVIRKDIYVLHTLHAALIYEYLFLLKKIIFSSKWSKEDIKDFMIFPVKLTVMYIRENLALSNAKLILVMSEYVKKTLMSFFPWINPEKVFVSKIGIDLKKFLPSKDKIKIRKFLNILDDEVVFFTARRLVCRMGLENLIKSFAIVCKDNLDSKKLSLLIAGKGPLLAKLEELIGKLNLHKNIKLLGFVTDEDLINYYQAADAFILPTEELEGFGIVTLEALSCNLPVIATPAGANPEVAGRFCPELISSDVGAEAMSEKIFYFLANISNYDNKNYRKLLEKEYKWDEIIFEIEKNIKKHNRVYD